MPKDEFDPEDPLELNGVAMLTHEDTTSEMAEAFTEEFMRMGYDHHQVLALFCNPHYLGPNMALEKRGEPFIRELITDVFARWGRKVEWPASDSGSTRVPRVESGVPLDSRRTNIFSPTELLTMGFRRDAENRTPEAGAPQETNHDDTLTDPMGSPIPKLNV
jgi:hypothetical protein